MTSKYNARGVSEAVFIRLTPEQKIELTDRAKAARVSVSKYVTIQLFKEDNNE